MEGGFIVGGLLNNLKWNDSRTSRIALGSKNDTPPSEPNQYQ